jgi:hypothetical protein
VCVGGEGGGGGVLAFPCDILEALLGMVEGSSVEAKLYNGNRNSLGILFGRSFQFVLQ